MQSVIYLDAGSRCWGHGLPGSRLSSLMLLDIRAAFPSVAHAWLRRVLRWMQFPSVFLRIFGALRMYVFAQVNIGGSLRRGFVVRGGVI